MFSDYKNIFTALFSAVLFSQLAACGGNAYIKETLNNTADEVSVGGEFLLHDNPQSGDYAVYKVMTTITTGSTQPRIFKMESNDRYEVVSVKQNQITVKISKTAVKVDTYSRGSLDNYSEEREMYSKTGVNEELYYLSSDRQIQKVVFINKTHGVKKEYKKSEPGKEGFLKYSAPEKGENITTPVGSFSTEKLTCEYPILMMKKFDDNKIKGYWVKKGQAEITAYISPDVKFRKVRSVLKSSHDRLIDVMLADGSGKWIPRKTTSSNTTEITMELIDQGSK
ncbi:MAG: hypothetical protein JW982_04190 [Spirochaetes bacterium]|nr:hypothetical protein [Spirochaetota bacterium]